jgi:hypothetical protein
VRPLRNVRSFGKNHDEREKEKVFVGPKSLPPTTEENLAKVEKILAINEAKTGKALKKMEDKQNTEGIRKVDTQDTEGIHAADKRETSGIQSKRTVSHSTLLCMTKRKVPRKLLDFIRDHAQKRGDTWISIMITDEVMEYLGKENFHLKKGMQRLKDEGWFEVEEASPGFRRLIINPKHYGLE